MFKKTGFGNRAAQTLLAAAILLLIIPEAVFAADYGAFDKILGVPGQMQEGALVFRFPRSDLKVSIDGEAMPTALGFGSWTAFKEMGADSMVMGDLVLLEKEVNPVIDALGRANIQVTAIHNHFTGMEPRLLYLHIYGLGATEALARGIRDTLSRTGTPIGIAGQSGPPPALKLDTKRIGEIIGRPGQAGGGAFKITVGRAGVKMNGVEVTSSMGLNSWAGFVGSDGRAHVAGDIAMTAPEVNRVIRVLRSGGIEVVAVHNHMLDEEPRIFFLHYWGTGPAERLALTIRDAFAVVAGPAR